MNTNLLPDLFPHKQWCSPGYMQVYGVYLLFFLVGIEYTHF